MSLRLEAIGFNHDTNAATQDAFNIRRNFDNFITLPEWTRNSPPSLAAYAIAETRGQQITIAVTLTSTAQETIFVRAETDAPSSQSFFANVSPQRVVFANVGQAQTVLFNLENMQLEQGGVNIYNFQWQWMQGPTQNGPWTPFDNSRHKIYAVLRLPLHGKPWRRGSLIASNRQLPWTEVLEVACEWARGATDLDTAAAMITDEVYRLGRTQVNIPGDHGAGPLLTYDFSSSATSHYLDWPTGFLCTYFLQRLRHQLSLGARVNCDDCAAIVSTFANVLGCELVPSWIGHDDPTPFTLNPILLIGAQPDNWRSTLTFNHHSVAWKEAHGVDNELFDACLRVDGDANPSSSSPVHTELLPANIRFGRSGERFYQFRLVRATPDDLELSAPLEEPEFRLITIS